MQDDAHAMTLTERLGRRVDDEVKEAPHGNGQDKGINPVNGLASTVAAPEYLARQGWLEERLAYWQRQLRLQDWEVSISYATWNDLQGKSGTNWWGVESKEAKIRVLPREEWAQESTRYGVWDEEQIIIHELLHLYFIDWETGDDNHDREYQAKELAIELLTAALMRFDRGIRR